MKISIEGWDIIDFTYKNGQYHIDAKPIQHIVACPNCGSQELYSHGNKKVRYVHTPYENIPTIINATLKRYKCKKCGFISQDEAPNTDKKRRMTKALLESIKCRCLNTSYIEIADDVGLNERTINNVCQDYFNEIQRDHFFDAPRSLGIHIITLNKTKRLILYNITEQTIYDIYPNTEEKSIENHLSAIPDKHRIALVVTLPNNNIINAVKTSLGKYMPIVIPKKIILYLLHETIRKCVKALISNESPEKNKMSAELLSLLMLPSHQLKSEKSRNFHEHLSDFGLLGNIYQLKEEFYSIYESDNISEANLKLLAWKSAITEDIYIYFEDFIELVSHFDYPILMGTEYREEDEFLELMGDLNRNFKSLTDETAFESLKTNILFTNGFKEEEIDSSNRNFNPNILTLSRLHYKDEDITMEKVNYGMPMETLFKRYANKKSK